MSLSKPFPLQKLPRLAFEHVLHQMYPLDLVELSNIPSESLLNRIKSASLVAHCDVVVVWDFAELMITMKTGQKFTWSVKNDAGRYCNETGAQHPECFLEGPQGSMVVNDHLELQNYKCTSTDTLYSLAYITGLEYSGNQLFSQLLSKFSCKVPIKTFVFAGLQEWVEIFIVDPMSIEKCEHLWVNFNRDNSFKEEVVNNFVATKKVTLTGGHDPPARFRNYQLKDYKELHLSWAKEYTGYTLNHVSNHKHLTVVESNLELEDLIEYLKSWQDGRHTQLKTFVCDDFKYNPALDLSILRIPNNLNLESSLPRDSPRFVKCSDVYLSTAITNDRTSRVVLLKNRHGKLATLALAGGLYFAVWEEPYTQVNIPNGHRMSSWSSRRSVTYPIYNLVPIIPEVFGNEEEVRLALEGFLTERQKLEIKRW